MSVIKVLFIPSAVSFVWPEEVTADFTKRSHLCNIVLPLVTKTTYFNTGIIPFCLRARRSRVRLVNVISRKVKNTSEQLL